MNRAIQSAAKAITSMDKYLRKDLIRRGQKYKLWEHTYIKQQIDKRQAGDTFSINDHIRAMVYSMLSSRVSWDKISSHIDEIDAAFYQYDHKQLKECNPEHLQDEVKKLRCGNPSIEIQMEALIYTDIPMLIQFESQFGSVDAFYQKYAIEDPSLKTLVEVLSSEKSDYKMAQLGEALIAEYLRNVGYSIAKPDRHIRRILGSRHLACSNQETVPIFEAFDIVAALAAEVDRPAAEVDYILWSYCATGYGEVCTASDPKCDSCVAQEYCHWQNI